jgi:predicted site-specific integrase-resolvase
METLLTRAQVANLLGVTAWTVDDLRRRGILPSVEFGPRRHRYTHEDVAGLIQSRRRIA